MKREGGQVRVTKSEEDSGGFSADLPQWSATGTLGGPGRNRQRPGAVMIERRSDLEFVLVISETLSDVTQLNIKCCYAISIYIATED